MSTEEKTSDEKPTLVLGQRVEFDCQLARVAKLCERPGRTAKAWERISWNGPKTGIVVGLRTLQNGETHWGSYDEPPTWHAESTLPAVLVAEDLRRKPVYVHRDDIRIAESLEASK